MISGSDPVDSFSNSVELVKNAFAPIEYGIGKFIKDSDYCWSGFKDGANNLGPSLTNNSKLGCCKIKHNRSSRENVVKFLNRGPENREGKTLSIECFVRSLFDRLVENLHKFDLGIQGIECTFSDSYAAPSIDKFNHLKALIDSLKGKGVDNSGFLGNLMFAKVGGVPSSIVTLSDNEKEIDGDISSGSNVEIGGNSPEKIVNGLSNVPLSSVESLRSTLLTASLPEVVQLMPHLRQSSEEHPEKNMLFLVQDFFRYTKAEGRRFFDELDRDGDGKVNLEDLEVALSKRKLPEIYARDLMRRTRSHLFSRSFGLTQFLSLMELKEPTILQTYTRLCMSKSPLQKSEIRSLMRNAGLQANDDDVVAMMQFLNADTENTISYGHFRNLLLLLPSDRLQEDPRRKMWVGASTVAAPVDIPAESVLKSALAGGLSCAFSSFVMHPIDTIKTQVQASTLTLPEIIVQIPQIGARGLYKGSIPAVFGQFAGHGLRTAICEASKLVLVYFAPTLPDIQVQSAASLCSTVLGTAFRVPTEVLKQRLQAGIYDNVGEALICTWQQDGLKGFFRGTGATLCREVPFYVAGMGLYAESKKAIQHLLHRELEPWETILVGAVSGGLASITTTPFDVIKTRMMTAPQGQAVSMSVIALSILRHEGPLGLFKGAVPRFFWVAPLGAMNFAGYELLRKAMDRPPQMKEVSTLQ